LVVDDGVMRTAPTALAQTPRLDRFVLVGMVVAGAIGGVVGLVVGLHVYPPTAWFAVFELGVPASVVGAVLGLASGVAARLFRRYRVGVREV
jgi:hypothetical protein